MKFTLPVAALVVCASASSASAQDAGQGNSALEQCRLIGDESERLGCYDRALDAMYGVDEELEQARVEAKADRFGLRNDDGGLENSELVGTISEVQSNIKYGTTVIALDNGQVWQVLDQGILRARFQTGDTVTIGKSALGGFRLRMEGRQGYRSVKRLR